MKHCSQKIAKLLGKAKAGRSDELSFRKFIREERSCVVARKDF